MLQLLVQSVRCVYRGGVRVVTASQTYLRLLRVRVDGNST